MKKLEEEERARKEAEEAAYAARMEEQTRLEAEEKGIVHVLTSLLSQFGPFHGSYNMQSSIVMKCHERVGEMISYQIFISF